MKSLRHDPALRPPWGPAAASRRPEAGDVCRSKAPRVAHSARRWTIAGRWLGLTAMGALALAACEAHRPSVPLPEKPRVVAPREAKPWWRGAVFYEIFVRSFQDSNGDGVGDLMGLVSRLDALNDGDPATSSDLGVDALWLMPVFESPSYHGYDTVDYERIERDYGSNEDFALLIAEAHRRGMRVFVDLVLNHTSTEHPWFLDAASGPGAARRDWYVWSPVDPGWGQPWNPAGRSWHRRGDAWYYGVFWSGMPDLNFRNEAVREELKRVAVQWARAGVDGFRLDAVKHLFETGPGLGQSNAPESHTFLRELSASIRAVNPEAALVGEVWDTGDAIAPYFGEGQDELQMAFNFPLASALVKAAWSGEGAALGEAMRETRRIYPPAAVDAPFLTNHDMARVASALDRDRARLGLAAAMLLTQPGAPFVYYGEELGMPNGPGDDDRWKRTPMLWSRASNYGFSTVKPWQEVAPTQVVAPFEEQARDPGSLLSRYRKLVHARKASPALRHGDLELAEVDSSKTLVFWRREGGGAGETVLVAHNLSSATVALTVGDPASGPRPASPEPLFVDPHASIQRVREGQGWSVTLPPLGTAVYRFVPAGP